MQLLPLNQSNIHTQIMMQLSVSHKKNFKKFKATQNWLKQMQRTSLKEQYFYRLNMGTL